MPFREEIHRGTYRPNELKILQQAYNESCILLGRCPTTHQDKARMAKAVLSVFENGDHDPMSIAEKVAVIETHIAVLN